MKNFDFWVRWLIGANVMTVIVGLLAAFAGNSIFFAYHNDQTELLFFGGNELAQNELYFKNWLFGIIGGTIVGFHILMIFIANNAYRKKEKWAYWAMWSGLLSWFVIDSSISTFYGAVYNVYLINIVALVLIGLPLIMTYQVFHKS